MATTYLMGSNLLIEENPWLWQYIKKATFNSWMPNDYRSSLQYRIDIGR